MVVFYEVSLCFYLCVRHFEGKACPTSLLVPCPVRLSDVLLEIINMCPGSLGHHHVPEKNTRNCDYDNFAGEQQQLLTCPLIPVVKLSLFCTNHS